MTIFESMGGTGTESDAGTTVRNSKARTLVGVTWVRRILNSPTLAVMDIAVQAVRSKTTRSLDGTSCGNDAFLRDVAKARAVFGGLQTEGRSLTSEEVMVPPAVLYLSVGYAWQSSGDLDRRYRPIAHTGLLRDFVAMLRGVRTLCCVLQNVCGVLYRPWEREEQHRRTAFESFVRTASSLRSSRAHEIHQVSPRDPLMALQGGQHLVVVSDQVIPGAGVPRSRK